MLDSTSSRMGNKTIELNDICKAYGERELIRDYSYIFLRHDLSLIHICSTGDGKCSHVSACPCDRNGCLSSPAGCFKEKVTE